MPHALFNPAFVAAFTAAAASAGNAAGAVVIVSQERTVFASATINNDFGPPIIESRQAAAPDAGPWMNSVTAGITAPSRPSIATASQSSAFQTDTPAGRLNISATLEATAWRLSPNPGAHSDSSLRLVFDVVNETASLPFTIDFTYQAAWFNDAARANLTGPGGPMLNWSRERNTINTFPVSPYSGVLTDGRYTLVLAAASGAGLGDQFPGRGTLGWSMTVVPAPGAVLALAVAIITAHSRRRR